MQTAGRNIVNSYSLRVKYIRESHDETLYLIASSGSVFLDSVGLEMVILPRSRPDGLLR